MKRFIFLAAFAALLLSAVLAIPARAAAADAGYAVADGSNVWFYETQDEVGKLFLLPRTYYVRVLSAEGEFSLVEYAADRAPYRALRGYCRTADLTAVPFVPARPYLERVLTFTYALPDKGGMGSSALSSFTRDVAYYGHRYENGQLYFYVLSEGVFGLIPAEEELEYELNTDYLAVPSPAEEGGLSGAEIAAVCVACAAAAGVAVFVVRGKRPHAAEQPEF